VITRLVERPGTWDTIIGRGHLQDVNPNNPTQTATRREDPADVAARLRGEPGLVFLDSSAATDHSISLVGARPDLVLDGTIGDWPLLQDELGRRRRGRPDLGYPDGAAVGWIGYDGSFRFGFYDRPGVYSHGSETWLTPPPNEPEAPPSPARCAADFGPEMGRDDFIGMVERSKRYIAAGDIYQVCLSHRFSGELRGDPWGLYAALREVSPAPHSAFLHLGDTRVLSSSPECFLRMSDRRILTRPIKGTRPRRRDPHQDELSAYDLITSPKEIAELVMITDLERNDLGRVCEFGSVTVRDLLQLQRHEQVFHLVSTVEGILRPGVGHPEALMECFPGGSISGAPKKRAMEIIAELEPVPRGLYTGAIGYFGYNGESGFNIAIRTVIARGNRASFHVGAGIVADSIPEREWQETLDKAAGILAAATSPGR